MISASPPVSRHRAAKLGSLEAGRFSGSRSSNLTRMGIATAYAPSSKYKVYWALLTAK